MKSIHYYVTESDKAPFLDRLNHLDIKSQVVVDRLVQRVASGGAKKSVKNLKDGDKIILLLIGGDKKTQAKDIKKAKEYWRSYGKQT